MTRTFRASVSTALAVLLCGAISATVHADRRTRTSVNTSRSVHRDVDIDRNVRRDVDIDRNVRRDVDVDIDRNVRRDVDIDIDRDRDIDIDIDRRGCCWGTAAAVATTAVVTAAAVGTRTYALPPNCTLVYSNGITYQQCGAVYYQPQFVGTTTSYVVVTPPR